MTLPFRRRHHDDDAAHDRARAAWSVAMLESLAPETEAWLAAHLASCAECAREREAYEADRALLRGLRDHQPEPPRDLWARTSAALDQEVARRRPAAARAGLWTRWRGLPLGVVAATLVVLVAVGSSLVPSVVLPSDQPPASGTAVAVASDVVPTPLTVAAANLSWIQATADGSYELVFADVDEVCPKPRSGCPPISPDHTKRTLSLADAPAGVAISPAKDSLVVVRKGDTARPGSVLVVPVPTNGTPASAPPVTPLPTGTGGPAATPATPSPSGPAESPAPTLDPSLPTPAPTPQGAVEIAAGVTVVGEAAYSPDSRWLAFSARPSDGTSGPDLYLWRVGSPAAVVTTSDHRTFFAGWLGGQVLASRVVDPESPAASSAPSPEASASAAVSPSATTTASPAPDASASTEPVAESRPVSFLLDPESGATTDLEGDIWLPVVGPAGRFVVYWSGTLRAAPDGLGWTVGSGTVVLDGWSAPLGAPAESPGTPSESPQPTASATDAAGPLPSPVPEQPGPARTPIALADRVVGAFQAMFDPSGERLALWTAAGPDDAVGQLELLVLDPATGAIDPAPAPLAGTPALRGFSLDQGRLAWVTPPGQDGQASSVQILAWTGREFGQVQTVPGQRLLIVR